MPDLLGFKVWIEMQGHKLEEYGPERTEGVEDEIACWVPGDIGAHQNFRVGLCIPPAPRTLNYVLVTYVDGVAKRWSMFPMDDPCPGGAVHKRYIEDLKFTRVGPHTELMGSVLVILATYDSSETDDEDRDTLVGQNVVGSVTFRYRDRDALVFDGIAPATGSAEDPGNLEASAQELQKLNTQILHLNVILRALQDRRFSLIQRRSMEVLEGV
ncbi:hypothetical protein FA13DRAFT_1789893 [Coprinellus micaceus]|uniref:Uncharacterized protein n=1 Tax=Coprinellus micaceus TaxID=71717 RepID=A0A4Y7THK3_COPMI|nr:hypothetical protein FA13DRAFT_1789893 [Coprinellus micaceus]